MHVSADVPRFSGTQLHCLALDSLSARVASQRPRPDSSIEDELGVLIQYEAIQFDGRGGASRIPDTRGRTARRLAGRPVGPSRQRWPGRTGSDASAEHAIGWCVQPFIESSIPAYLMINGDPLGIVDFVIDFPIPLFGSPPYALDRLGHLLRTTAGTAASGYLAETGHPVLAVVSAAGTFVYWFAQPAVRVLRHSLAERVAAAVGTTLRPEDER